MNSSNQETSNKKNYKSSKKTVQTLISEPNSLTQNSQLFFHAGELSKFIQQNRISNQLQLNTENRKNINQLIFNVVSDLLNIDSFPNIQLNNVTTTYEVYRVLSLALYAMMKSNNSINDNLSIENIKLKNELFELQKNYNQLLQSKSDLKNSKKKGNQSELKNLQVFKYGEIEKYKEIEKEVSNLIIYLKHHFNLSETTNLYNIIDAINIKCTCEVSEKDRIEQLMMQNKDLEDRLISLQNEKYEVDKKLFDQKAIIQNEANSQAFVLENEISALKTQLKKITQKYESKKAKSQSLTKTVDERDEIIKQLTRDLEISKINYDKLLIDFEDKKKNSADENQTIISKNDLQIKEDEISNLHSALNELSTQLEKMNEDLKQEATMKNHLFNAFQIQNSIMNLMEQRLKEEIEKTQKASKRDLDVQFKPSIFTNFNIEEEDNEKDENILNDIFLFLSKSDLDKSEIGILYNILQNDELTISSKITSILKALITKLNQKAEKNKNKKEVHNDDDQKSLKNQNDRLKKYLSNLLYFIEQITNSGEMQRFFIESDINYDFREKLIAQFSRIESFMKENGIDIDEGIYLRENDNFIEKFLNISHLSNYIEEQLYNPDSEELLLLLRQFTFVNESIRRFADEMKQQVEKFLSEIKQLRYQISECQEHHTEELNKMTDALQNENQKERALKSVIVQIKSTLYKAKATKIDKSVKVEKDKSKDCTEVLFDEEEEEGYTEYDENSIKLKNNDSYILKCLQLIQKVDNISINSPNEKEQDSNYIKKLELKLNNEIDKRKSIQNKANEEITRLKSKIKLLKKQSLSDKQKFIEEIDYAKKQFDDLSVSLSEANNNDSSNNKIDVNNDNSKIEIDEKNSLINSLNEKIQQKDEEISKLKGLFDLEKEKILLDYQNQNQKIFKEKDEKISSLLQSLENSQSNSEVKVKEVKQDLKQTIKKLQNEINLETERANNIRNHFEKILQDLKDKLFQSRQSEKAAIEKVNNVENELKKAKSTISKLRIDVKMLNLKVASAEDKLIREKSLFDSQLKMKILGLQTDHQDRINEIKEKYENRNHKFCMKIFEIFKDFIDFDMTFSDDSILNTLQKVSESLSKTNQKLIRKKSLLPLLNDIKSLLNVNNNSEIVGALTNLVNEANEYKEKKLTIQSDQKKTNFLLNKAKAISNNENTSRNWEIWARRLYSLITDSFSTKKDIKQLQYAIEEALLSAIGQRQLWKKLEILRKEKLILELGLTTAHVKKSNTDENYPPSLTSLIATYISVYRMQKLAGHLKFNIDFSPKSENC